MATVSEVKSFLKKNLNIEELSDSGLMVFNWTFEDKRSQVVLVSLTERHMQILSPFAKIGQITADRALDANETVWGVTKVLEAYNLTHIVLLDDANSDEIMIPLGVVAAAADELEKKLGLGDHF